MRLPLGVKREYSVSYSIVDSSLHAYAPVKLSASEVGSYHLVSRPDIMRRGLLITARKRMTGRSTGGVGRTNVWNRWRVATGWVSSRTCGSGPDDRDGPPPRPR